MEQENQEHLEVQQDKDTLQTRYRPHSWEGVIGQSHIVNVFKGIVKNKTYAHTRSYILHGCITEDTKIRVRIKKNLGKTIKVSDYEADK